VPDKLASVLPYDGYALDLGGVCLRVIIGKAVVSVAVPKGGMAALNSAMKKAYKLDMPKAGHSTTSHAGSTRLVFTAPDQFFLIFDEPLVDTIANVRKQIGGAGYLSCLSDSYVIVKISGAACREALERICPIDLDDKAFPLDMAARTVMEHLGVMIIRDTSDSFILMSPRSSAGSFLHAIEVSVRNL
jgi:sarcosine oxidase subunit gamma